MSLWLTLAWAVLITALCAVLILRLSGKRMAHEELERIPAAERPDLVDPSEQNKDGLTGH